MIDKTKSKTAGLALIVVDLQEKLLTRIHNRSEILNSVKLLIQAANIFEIKILLTEQVPEKLGNTVDMITDLLSDSETIEKNTFSIFGSESFKESINDSKIDHLILCGVETSICVYLSAIDAVKAGIDVTILCDCVGGRRIQDSEVALKKLEQAGCHILPLETFLYGMMENTDYPKFKEIINLVKDR